MDNKNDKKEEKEKSAKDEEQKSDDSSESEENEDDEEEEENDDKNNKDDNKDNNNIDNINIQTTNFEEEEEIFNKLIFNKYKLIQKLGEGSFGKVFKAEYKSKFYAVKFENREEGQDLLKNEARIMSYLKGNPHIPKAHSYGFSGNYNIFVMQLLDKSLEDIFNIRQKFSLKTGAMLAYQMISALQYIHSKHIIHRDIKPDNFVLGADEYNAYLYLLDFGLAKKYRSSKNLKQIPYLKKKKLTGTARYASIHAMEEMEQSRRDDLEAVSYVIMYFIRGDLPWQGLKLKSNEDRYQKILEKKKEVTTEELCSEYPKVFYEFVKYAKGMKYYEEPKYDELKKKFVDFVTNVKKEKFDYVFDWTTKNDLKLRKEKFDITLDNMNNDMSNNNKDENIHKENKIEKIEEKEDENEDDEKEEDENADEEEESDEDNKEDEKNKKNEDSKEDKKNENNEEDKINEENKENEENKDNKENKKKEKNKEGRKEARKETRKETKKESKKESKKEENKEEKKDNNNNKKNDDDDDDDDEDDQADAQCCIMYVKILIYNIFIVYNS